MSLQTKVIENPNAAILCQNHPVYLAHAAKIGDKFPDRRITFRTSALWRSGEKALDSGPRTIYFVPEGELEVRYQGRLEAVYLHPSMDDPRTQELLELCLPETRDQGLWEQYDEKVRTLYVVSHCRALDDPFPYTALIKISDDTPVSENYTYGYVLVHEHEEP
jgi:hypothetical protein